MADILYGWAAELADRYRIDRTPDGKPQLLGQGGMATVYSAVDLKHQRKVAIKLLRPDLAAVVGAERFLQEIRVTANLQHPHIIGLLDSGVAMIEDAAGAKQTLLYYVMPLVEGESLRQRLTREIQLPVDTALDITKAVAGALDYAHRHGVIHRDIKPENILFHDGQVLVTDFGIALALTTAGGTRLTDSGIAIGTPQYMSPEQSFGQRDIGSRSDIYALGCVLYEMLTGEPPFTGPTVQSIAAKAARDTPQPVRVARPSVPHHVDKAVAKALAKLPADRFETPGQFASALGDPKDPATGTILVNGPGPAVNDRRVFALAGVLLLTIVVAVWGWLRPQQQMAATGVKRFEIPLPPDVPARESFGSRIAIAPDGKSIAYLGITDGVRRLFIRSLDQTEPRLLPGSEGASAPFFSPDSKWLGFVVGDKMKKMAVAGGPALNIASVQGSVLGSTWGEGGVIVYASVPEPGLWLVTEEGSSPRLLARPDSSKGEYLFLVPDFLPGGRAVLTSTRLESNDNEIGILWLDTGKRMRLLPGSSPRYAGADRIVFVADGFLQAARFDAAGYRVLGSRWPLKVRVNRAISEAEFTVSHEGTLAYLPEPSRVLQLTLVDRSGAVQTLVSNPAHYNSPRFSPDGAEVAVGIGSESGSDIWVYSPTRPTAPGSRLTFTGHAYSPVWAPDGQTIAYDADEGISLASRQRPGADSSLLAGPAGSAGFSPDTWTPDGRWVIGNDKKGRLWLIPRDSALKPHRFSDRSAFELLASVSPDGRWLAYTSNESGQWEVYVEALSSAGGRAQVSIGGGLMPVWGPDGKELFYRSSNRLYAAAVTTATSFAVGNRVMLFESAELRSPDIQRDYDVSPDGQRFVMLRRSHPLETLVVVLNWPQDWVQEEGRHATR